VTTYDSTTDLAAAARLIRDTAGPIVIVTHGKPDGDAFGSVVALAAALRGIGKDVSPWFVPPVPANLQKLPGAGLVTVYDERFTGLPDPGKDGLCVVLDTGAYIQVGSMRPVIERNLDRTLIIDHHLSGDIPAKHRVIDGSAAACAELIAQLIEAWPLQRPCPTIDTALFTGLASDTGWFRFSNVTPRTHRLAADLIERGVDHAELYRVLEQTERPQKLLLLCRALGSLELLAGGKAALMVLRLKDFEETGAIEAETERLIDVPQQVASVQVVALVTERKGTASKPVTAVSFRSKPGEDAVNVAALAGQFGGGGHARAAGAKLNTPFDEALQKIKASIEAAVG
jgi:phosphoesterase RecJ-like protein